MARSPVTRIQLDAYRFGQRRMECALALRDPVPLHEEPRTQRRVVVTGLALAVFSLVAVFGYAKFSPQPAWNAQLVVVGAQSGRLFAVIHQPDRLVPVANLAAARLVLHAAERAAGARGGPVAGDSAATATPVAVDDKALDSAPRTAAAALPGAAAALPTADDPPVPAGPWALCDSPGPDGRATTTLIANAGPSAPLGPAGGLLLEGPDGQVYLVVDRTKYRVDTPEARQAYDLRDHVPRPVSAALLAAIPDGQPLGAPTVPGAGQDSAVLPGHVVGDVVRVPAPGQPDRHYLVLASGVQDIPVPVAALVRATLRADVNQAPDSVPLEQVNAAPRVVLAELARYPAVLPRIVDPPDAGTVCRQWPASGLGGTVTTSAAPPVPPGRPVTQLAQAGRPGALDAVSLPAGGALVACAVATQPACPAPGERATEPTASGGAPLWLVSETGVGYPIANAETAGALGVTSAVPVPADALRMLPTGPTLDAGQAQRTVDVLVSAPAG